MLTQLVLYIESTPQSSCRSSTFPKDRKRLYPIETASEVQQTHRDAIYSGLQNALGRLALCVGEEADWSAIDSR